MARTAPAAHIDSRASHAIHPTQTGLFHERKRFVDGSRGVLRPPRGDGREFRRHPCAHGQRHPRAGDGRGGAGEIRPSRHAHGHVRRRNRAVLAVPDIRSGRSCLARPRPLRAVGRPRLDADLRAALSHRLCRGDAGRDQALPPARLEDARPPGKFHHAGRRDHDWPARARLGQRGRHGDRREASRRRVRRRGGEPQDLRDRERRRPDGRHQPRGHRARRALEAQQVDRAVRRQRHFHRRRAVAVGIRSTK